MVRRWRCWLAGVSEQLRDNVGELQGRDTEVKALLGRTLRPQRPGPKPQGRSNQVFCPRNKGAPCGEPHTQQPGSRTWEIAQARQYDHWWAIPTFNVAGRVLHSRNWASMWPGSRGKPGGCPCGGGLAQDCRHSNDAAARPSGIYNRGTCGRVCCTYSHLWRGASGYSADCGTRPEETSPCVSGICVPLSCGWYC